MDKGRALRLRIEDTKVALDTNILVYIEGVNGPGRGKEAAEIVAHLPRANTFVPVQVLGELFRVLIRKAKYTPEQARTAVRNCFDIFPTIETSPEVLLAAADLNVAHGLDIWDAMIFAAASSAGCRLLLSEDLQDGFGWHGVTVANPFATSRNSLLVELLGK
ncbi:MAG TPA: PIN domain-containing protein [Candidatus Sulfotelmatobacter sp.]|jgi:predicted nucleic acid-binding protein